MKKMFKRSLTMVFSNTGVEYNPKINGKTYSLRHNLVPFGFVTQ